jgi:tight adherence protein C
MRIRRRQRAEEQAHKAPILMMIPMVFLIFPATYIVLLGPAVPKVMQAFGGL